eukprot:TRINITY_DN12475_c0_g1_i1.p1 TRINITY_DN12475_c0_g1~~TRINITY_DN12475_c0_g1_i1.p1  ORF type:complete len:158 (-),score=15.81 TRINITY_DN12475_c0_g1_i1:77-550(-)
MPTFSLCLRCTLENVTNLKPDPSFTWRLKLKCNNCKEVTDKFVTFSAQDQIENPTGRGTVNLLVRCKFCKRESSIDVLPKTQQNYNINDSGKFKPIIAFDCRGVTPEDWNPQGSYTCQGVESETVFKFKITDEAEWVDYDEKASLPTSILDWDSKFV